MVLASPTCSPAFPWFTLPIFYALFASMDPAYFFNFSSLLAFSVQQAAPLRFDCLLILVDKT